MSGNGQIKAFCHIFGSNIPFFKKTKEGENPLKPIFYKFCFSPGTEGISDGERRHW